MKIELTVREKEFIRRIAELEDENRKLKNKIKRKNYEIKLLKKTDIMLGVLKIRKAI